MRQTKDNDGEICPLSVFFFLSESNCPYSICMSIIFAFCFIYCIFIAEFGWQGSVGIIGASALDGSFYSVARIQHDECFVILALKL